MSLGLLAVDPASYVCHPIHAGEQVWSETNCYVDLWVEVLHSLGLDPVPALAAALSADFDGSQWSFLKFAPEDLRRLYGIEVSELNLWRSVLEHVLHEREHGRLLTVEVDAFWLPDTAGTSYRGEHTKTTIVLNRIDVAAERAEYFHNSGYFALSDEDFRGVFHLDGVPAEVLPPYVETIRLDAAHPPQRDAVLGVVRAHLGRRPERNPVAALAEGVQADLSWLRGGGLELFHRWSFGVLRQCGATAELAAELTRYLGGSGASDMDAATEHFTAVAVGAKSVQFRLARAARGREVTVTEELTAMAASWGAAMDLLVPALLMGSR